MIYVVSGGGGGKLVAVIAVTYPAGSVCTCSNGTKTLKAKDTSGKALFNVTAGSWTVTAASGSHTKSQTVTVTEGTGALVELKFSLVLFDNGDIPALTGGWQSSGSGGSASATTTINLYAKDETGYIKTRVLVTKNPIDLSGYTTLYANVRTVSGVCSMDVGDTVATKQITATGTSFVDVSGVASAQTIGFEIAARSSESHLVVTKVWLE